MHLCAVPPNSIAIQIKRNFLQHYYICNTLTKKYIAISKKTNKQTHFILFYIYSNSYFVLTSNICKYVEIEEDILFPFYIYNNNKI